VKSIKKIGAGRSAGLQNQGNLILKVVLVAFPTTFATSTYNIQVFAPSEVMMTTVHPIIMTGDDRKNVKCHILCHIFYRRSALAF